MYWVIRLQSRSECRLVLNGKTLPSDFDPFHSIESNHTLKATCLYSLSWIDAIFAVWAFQCCLVAIYADSLNNVFFALGVCMNGGCFLACHLSLSLRTGGGGHSIVSCHCSFWCFTVHCHMPHGWDALWIFFFNSIHFLVAHISIWKMSRQLWLLLIFAHFHFHYYFQEENLAAMNTDPLYSAYHYSHPPLVERLAALDDPDNKKDD